MSTDAPDSNAVEETKQQIRGLVSEIVSLTRQDLEPAVFYGEFLQRVVTALAAVGGAVWTLRDRELRLTSHINIRQAFPEDNPSDQARHGRLLHRVISGEEQLLVPPYSGTSGDEEAGNPTSFLLVLAPIRDDEKVVGVVEVFQRPTSGPASQRGYLRFLSEMCQNVSEYLKSRRLRELTDWQSLFTEVDRFSRAVHEGLDPSATAYTIANEGRRLIGCDRVSVGMKRGSKCRIEAVSGQDTMDTRANSVTLLSKLATAVVRSGETLWYTGSSEDLPPQIEDAVHDYVDETHTKTVAVIPLRPPLDEVPDGDESKEKKRVEDLDPIGALIVEQIEDSRSPAEFSQTVDLVCEHSSRALSNSLEHNNLFLMPVWRAIGNAKWILQAKTLPKTLAIFAAVLVALALLCFFPWAFEMEAKGELQPKERRNVFVSVPGTVKQLLVQDGSEVKEGDTLAILQNTELVTRLSQLQGELATTRQTLSATDARSRDQRLTAVEQNRLAGESLKLQTDIANLNKQILLVRDDIEKLTIKSPMDGIVLGWNLERNFLLRPLNRGDKLLTVADPTGDWEAEIQMEEDRSGHIARNHPADPAAPYNVRYILKSDPKNQLEGKLYSEKIDQAAFMNEENILVVRMVFDINRDELEDPAPGTEIVAKVDCGTRPIGYVWFHELIEFLQSTLFF
ncbi:MAG: biotin/lipoyl-binding protein [Planctomycetota bacterium]